MKSGAKVPVGLEIAVPPPLLLASPGILRGPLLPASSPQRLFLSILVCFFLIPKGVLISWDSLLQERCPILLVQTERYFSQGMDWLTWFLDGRGTKLGWVQAHCGGGQPGVLLSIPQGPPH